MHFEKSEEGFTLIEMMIVVVIIGILAAIAIPQFARYQLKSKTSEATRNIGAVRTAEEAFSAKWGKFVLASGVPVGTPGAQKQAWVPPAGNGWLILGFQPSGKVYYQYAVGPAGAVPANGTMGYSADSSFDTSGEVSGGQPATGGDDVLIVATGDLDGETTFGSYFVGDESSAIGASPGTTGEIIF
jgi:type IV pilus assembly protein PilA